MVRLFSITFADLAIFKILAKGELIFKKNFEKKRFKLNNVHPTR